MNYVSIKLFSKKQPLAMRKQMAWLCSNKLYGKNKKGFQTSCQLHEMVGVRVIAYFQDPKP